MPGDPPTIYATTVLGQRVRMPGVVHIGFGLDGFEREGTEPVLRLALPLDTARSLSATLAQAAGTTGDAALTNDRETEAGEAFQIALRSAGMVAFQQLLVLVADDPAFVGRLDEVQRQLLTKTRTMVTAGVSTEHETGAMRVAGEVLEHIFKQVRTQAHDGSPLPTVANQT